MNANVVEASRRAGARKVTVMGTGAVYPFPSPGLPLKEDMIFMGRPHPAHAGLRERQARNASDARSLSGQLRLEMGVYRFGEPLWAARQVRYGNGKRRTVR